MTGHPTMDLERQIVHRRAADTVDLIPRLHRLGLSLSDAAGQVGLSVETFRGRARRLGIRWTADPIESPYEALSEAERRTRQIAADRKLIRAVAQAFARGEHLPGAAA